MFFETFCAGPPPLSDSDFILADVTGSRKWGLTDVILASGSSMAYGTRSYARPYIGSFGLSGGIKWLLIVNTAVFVLQSFSRGTWVGDLLSYLALVPAAVVKLFFVWQLVTYMFLHGGFMHLLFNMLTLWMFGRSLEETWGTRRFLQYYFFCGIGAGVCVVLLNYLFGSPGGATVGASGAIFGLLLACAVLWPDQIVFFNFFFPMKMKYMVMLYGAIAFWGALSANSGVSNVAHLGGMAFGYLFLKLPRTRGFNPLASVRESYRDWKLARAKRKFQVYMRKQRSDRGPWVN